MVAKELGGAFPELVEKQAMVVSVVAEEEKAFSTLLERGVKYFSEMSAEIKAQGGKVIPGDRAFYLYDTLGFPIDLTQIMASEQGFDVDVKGFQAAMTEQKERSRVATRTKRLAGRVALTLGAEQTAYLARDAKVAPTDDSSKYTWDHSVSTTVKAIFTEAGFVQSAGQEATVGIILEKSPFYAEAGGQVADTGIIAVTLPDGKVVEMDVLDVQVR
jgi:alanyl-tRNA synthetase